MQSLKSQPGYVQAGILLAVFFVLYFTVQPGELRPVFRTVCLLTLRGHFPSHIFESLFWRFVADA